MRKTISLRLKQEKDLGENDVMTVAYQVVFEKRIEGAVKNTAVAGSDNTEDDQDENTVVVKPPVLKIAKKYCA